jgi:hypothetical protein
MKFGRDRVRVEKLLVEMGDGTFDPETLTGSPGDGALAESTIDEHRSFRFALPVGRRLVAALMRARGSARTVAPAAKPRSRTVASSTVPTAATGAPSIDSARSIAAFAAHALILDRTLKKISPSTDAQFLDHVDVTQLVQRIAADLDRARERGEVLLRVSVTLPPWNHDGATIAAHIFRDRVLSMGASGILLARDRRKDGAPHWYGFVTVPDGADRARVRDQIARAWQDASYATATCVDIVTVTGWDAFAANDGDLDAPVGRGESLRTNLTRALGYSFKPWPEGRGRRNLRFDVVETGYFVGLSRACAFIDGEAAVDHDRSARLSADRGHGRPLSGR